MRVPTTSPASIASTGASVLRLAWWNTHLSPRRGSRVATDEQWQTVAEVASGLFRTDGADVLAVGEVTPEDVFKLRTSVSSDLQLFCEDRADVRVGMLYDGTKLKVLDYRKSMTAYAGKSLVRGFEMSVVLLQTNTRASLFLMHWPSRMVAQAERERKALGSDLRSRIRELQEEQGESTPILVVGDFNDEPFDVSMSDELCGSRDRTLVRRNPGLLYNPFWRWLGEQQTLAEERSGRLGAGTHFFRSDHLSWWFTFDQALVSHSLLGGSGWVLWEEGTGVCPSSQLLDDGRMVVGFDHLPIVVTLIQEANSEEIPK